MNKRGSAEIIMEEKLINYMRIFQKIDKVKLKGAGEKTVHKLKELNISDIKDLIYFFPRSYEDRTNIKSIKDIKDGEFAVLQGEVLQNSFMRIRNGKNIFKIVISDDTGLFEAVWFQMPYLQKSLVRGENVILTGRVKYDMGLKMINPEYKIVSEEESAESKILPVYNLVSGISQNVIRKIIKAAVDEYMDYFFEIIPQNIMDKYSIMGRKEALLQIHEPDDMKAAEEAKRRFIIEELFTLEVGILAKRFEIDNQNHKKYSIEDKKEMAKDYLRNLGFEMTKAQKKVITEIYKDISAGKIVNRLIQGDVGSGKTAVAVIMLIYMAENGYQGAFMAPTEILAEQHFLSMAERLQEIGLRVEILTSGIKGKKKAEIIEKIKKGEADIVIGTHALIEESVEFNNLGLIVIDEQHRFGVMQRKELRDKGVVSNLVVMSATPIPRSLALSIYGDLDVSIIDELPPGRKPVKTKWIKNDEKEKLFTFIKRKITEGRQCYIVCPLIEESEKMSMTSVEEVYNEIMKDVFREHKVAMLHGKMTSSEKEQIMREFKNNNINILVSTTVIEVGVNVPNASVMVILDAQRFGLAQLHQLRGRVGRGTDESFCFLISDTTTELSVARLKIMEKTNDGFEIAEEDLKLRKSGDIFGTKQSGIGEMRSANILSDVKTIKMVRDEAIEFLKRTRGKVENNFLREEIKHILNFEWVNN